MRFSPGAAIALLILGASASPLHARDDQGYKPSPCSAIDGLVKAANAISPNPTPTIPAEAAWKCLQSVPLNTNAALALVKSLRPFMKWQSTTAYLKNPPPEYIREIQYPVDVEAGMDQIEENLRDGKWTKEYDFGFSLYTLLQSTHDGHFTYFPDSIFKIFTWGRPVPIVSVSEDGSKLPSIFVYSDILATTGNVTYQPSAITKINGEEIMDWLEDFSQVGSLQDRDALWNNMFYELAQVSLGTTGTGTGTFSGGGRGRVIYPGPITEFTFANGTTASYNNYARVLVDFAGITSGEDVYKKYFTPPDSTFNLVEGPKVKPTETASVASTAATPAPGYPSPIFREAHNLIGGYFLDDPAYADVAVLSVPSFVGEDDAEISFQQTGQNFIAAAKAAGKTKLIVDVSANAGGTILQGYDLFKQLFPTTDPYAAADRLRAHQAVELIGEVFSNVSGRYPRNMDQDPTIIDTESAPLDYKSDINVLTGTHFNSWKEKYGPMPIHDDFFTHTWRWDLSDPLTPWQSGGIEITGYGLPAPAQPFKAEDVVVVYDGYCASTCTIFSELMRDLVGVEAVAMGGRPSTDQIQAVGGTKGTNNFPWSYIQTMVEETYNFSTPEQVASYEHTELAQYNTYLPFYRAVGEPNVNARDGIRKDDWSMTPLQFVYQEADCRIFYTPQMTVDISAMWKAVADAKWLGKEKCVAGGLGGKKGDDKKRMLKRGITERAVAGPVPGSQLKALKDSMLLETNTWTGRVANGVMVP
jgi:hypothetical protein